MGLFDFLKPDVGKVVKDTTSGIGDLVKDVRTAITGDIPAEMKAKLLDKALDLINGLLQYQSNTIVSEAQGKSWLQRNWRPLTMINFLILIDLIFAGLINNTILLRMKLIPTKFWDILLVGIGGYIGGRTIEKTAVTIGNMIKKK